MNEMMLASEMHHEPRFSDFMDIEMTSLSWFGANKGENVMLTELNLDH